VTVIRITSARIIAVPYNYDRAEWVQDQKKILDVKIRGPAAPDDALHPIRQKGGRS
jgi:hypothetical protein